MLVLEKTKIDAQVLDFTIMGDERGQLIALEEDMNIPFELKRVFYIYNTVGDIRRGNHANRFSRQVLVCTSGSCKIHLDNGVETMEVDLDRPNKGLYIANNVWREMYDFSEDCVLMVLSNKLYDPDEYIRDHKVFNEMVKNNLL